METNIHSTAIVSSKAKLGGNVKVDAYAIIEDDVEIGEGSVVGPHACIYDGARIGKNVKIFQAAAVSNAPQDLKYAGEDTEVIIGDNVVIREFVTINKGTVDKHKTVVEDNVLLMAYAQLANMSWNFRKFSNIHQL